MVEIYRVGSSPSLATNSFSIHETFLVMSAINSREDIEERMEIVTNDEADLERRIMGSKYEDILRAIRNNVTEEDSLVLRNIGETTYRSLSSTVQQTFGRGEYKVRVATVESGNYVAVISKQ